jgi:hypothetical protein
MLNRFLFILCLGVAGGLRAAEPVPPQPTAHTARAIEGWTLQVDNRLLTGVDAELGERALALMATRLYQIKLVVPADKVKRLKQVTFYMDRTCGPLTSMGYHPEADWLAEHGYLINMAKCIQIPDTTRFVTPEHYVKQPWAVLHELAHAYHDQVLGFDHPGIMAAWKKFVASGKYESVLHIYGHNAKHYALTDQKEFFAEMTESYFGVNDFYPFNRAELKQAEPAIAELLHTIWESTP